MEHTKRARPSLTHTNTAKCRSGIHAARQFFVNIRNRAPQGRSLVARPVLLTRCLFAFVGNGLARSACRGIRYHPNHRLSTQKRADTQVLPYGGNMQSSSPLHPPKTKRRPLVALLLVSHFSASCLNTRRCYHNRHSTSPVPRSWGNPHLHF